MSGFGLVWLPRSHWAKKIQRIEEIRGYNGNFEIVVKFWDCSTGWIPDVTTLKSSHATFNYSLTNSKFCLTNPPLPNGTTECPLRRILRDTALSQNLISMTVTSQPEKRPIHLCTRIESGNFRVRHYFRSGGERSGEPKLWTRGN